MNAYVTAPQKESSRWLFLSTIDVKGICMSCTNMQRAPLIQCVGGWAEYIPLCFGFAVSRTENI